jgi:NAD(P)H-hydrate epimerase
MKESKGLPVKQIREVEQRAKDIGLEERILIENASSNLFEVINGLNLGTNVLVVAGRGNNGADVLSCARKLASHGYDTKVIIVKEKELGEEVLFQKDVLEKVGISVCVLDDTNVDEFSAFLKKRDFILEGILGIGIRGEVSPFLKKIIGFINDSGKRIVSCDIPSGLCPDDGKVLGEAVRADYTITFIADKEGFFSREGKDLCGKVFVVDIGVSKELLR